MYHNGLHSTAEGAERARKNSSASVRPERGGRTLDAIDRKILSALSKNGQLTMSELSDSVGLSASPCWTRVRRLEESGVIEKYVAVLDNQMVGLDNVVFIEITLDKHDRDAVHNLGEKLARLPEVLEVYHVAGEYDFLVKVVASDPAEYDDFLRQKLYSLPGIARCRSIFKLRTIKRAISIDPLLLG